MNRAFLLRLGWNHKNENELKISTPTTESWTEQRWAKERNQRIDAGSSQIVPFCDWLADTYLRLYEIQSTACRKLPGFGWLEDWVFGIHSVLSIRISIVSSFDETLMDDSGRCQMWSRCFIYCHLRGVTGDVVC